MIRAGLWSDRLRYAIHFSKVGDYRVWLLGQSGGSAGSDGVKILFDRRPDPKAEEVLDMRLEAQPGWSSQAFRVRAQTNETPMRAVIRVSLPGWHNLYVVKGQDPQHQAPVPSSSYRFPNWRVDKIVVQLVNLPEPQGDGPRWTANSGELQVPVEMQVQNEYRPRQSWHMGDGVAVIEAEVIDHHHHWVEKTAPAGFTGTSYLEWQGPSRSRSIEGLGGNNDNLHVRQGPPEEQLIVRLLVDKPGAYLMDVRNHHVEKDGDNDAWVGRVGIRATGDKPIVRLGDGLKDGTGFTWLDWGVHRFEFLEGLNEVYIGGRSIGFGVDRIAFYREGDAASRARALDPSTPKTSPTYVLSAPWDFLSKTGGDGALYYRDLRSPDNDRQSLAINAKLHKDKFATATARFSGPAGRYDLTIGTLLENDGESTYRLRVRGRMIGTFQNPSGPDGKRHYHTWPDVHLNEGDILEVESNTHSNGRIPEGNGFAWARGRWTNLRIASPK